MKRMLLSHLFHKLRKKGTDEYVVVSRKMLGICSANIVLIQCFSDKIMDIVLSAGRGRGAFPPQ